MVQQYRPKAVFMMQNIQIKLIKFMLNVKKMYSNYISIVLLPCLASITEEGEFKCKYRIVRRLRHS